MRRCNIDGNKFSVVLDEDHNRTQYSERASYVAWDYFPPIPDDYCPYFPNPAQGWEDHSRLAYLGQKEGNYDYYIGGWSQEYVDNNLTSNRLKIGFDTVTNINGWEPTPNDYCEVGSCTTGGERAEMPPDTRGIFDSDEELKLTQHNYNNECPADGSNPYCKRLPDENGVPVISITDNLKLFQINGWDSAGAPDLIINFEPEVEIEEINIDKLSLVHFTYRFASPGNYFFTSLAVGNYGQYTIELGKNIVWHIQDSLTFGSAPIDIAHTGKPDDFIIYGPNADINILGELKNPFYGLILGEKVLFNHADAWELYGAVTSNNLMIMSYKGTIHGKSQCFSEIPDNYTIEIAEEKVFALDCETPEFIFTVRDDSNSVVTDFNGEVKVTLPSALTATIVQGSLGSTSQHYKPQNGTLKLALTGTKYTEGTPWEIKAELEEFDSSDTAKLYIAPYKFETSSINAIAADSTTLNIEVKACKNETPTIVESYDGDKTITLSSKKLSQPAYDDGTTGAFDGKLTINNEELNIGNTAETTLKFTKGKASTTLQYDESGQVDFSISDLKFTCPSGFDSCKDEDDNTWEGLTGAITAYVRPWSFVICDSQDATTDGTSSENSAYKKAGESFSLKVRPVNKNAEGKGNDCSDVSLVTRNFFMSDAPKVTLYQRGKLHTPVSGRLGSGSSFLSAKGATLDSNSRSGTRENPRYEFNGQFWNEVGSLTVSVDLNDEEAGTTTKYLNGEVETGTRNIGRFVPNHLRLVDDGWLYASGHTDFAYMEQEITHSFTVQAESSKKDTDGNILPTENYGLFDNKYKAGIDLKAIIKVDDASGDWEEANGRITATKTWSGSMWNKAKLEVIGNTFSFAKLGLNGSNRPIHYGPYTKDNCTFGLVSSKVDSVDFEVRDFDTTPSPCSSDKFSGKKFSAQPNLRYGRMTLKDVNGIYGQKITIPLKVEYWDGEQFITNIDDSGSTLNSNRYCHKMLWSRGTTGTATPNINLSGASSSPSVTQGKYDLLVASQTTGQAEQYKFWLRQGKETTGETGATCKSSYENQPWLQYYWSGKSQEDPSTIVTFGTTRGNDRLIFRGETGL